MLMEAARFQEDPQQKSLTVDAHFSPNPAADPDLGSIAQINKPLVSLHVFLLCSLEPIHAGRLLAPWRQPDARSQWHVRHAALFRKRGAAGGDHENGKGGQEPHWMSPLIHIC
jgi:hypothetical protein